MNKNNVIFFEKGPTGVHQLHNHVDSAGVYLDLRTAVGIDVWFTAGGMNFLSAAVSFEGCAEPHHNPA